MERRSLAEYIPNFLARGEETAYVQRRGYRREHWSYQQVAQTAFQFARELEARDVGKGERILIWGPNSAQWVAVFLGCLLRGVIAVPIDDVSAPDFALRVHRQVEARLLVCSKEHLQAEFPAIALEDLPSVLSRHSPTPYDVSEVVPEDTLEIVFTSGTTAEPKGVVISHGNVLSNIAPLESEIGRYLKYERLVHPVRFLNLLPMSHVFGQFLGIFLPQIMGGVVVFQDSLNPSEIISTVHHERISVLVSVPRVLQSIKQKVERDLQAKGGLTAFKETFRAAEGRHFLHRWWIFRTIRRRFGWKFWAFISGGAALDGETEQFWDRLGYAVIQGYGLTETTSLISVNHPFRLGKGSIGKVLAGREVKLAEDGEILVRGGGVASGYWNANELQPMASSAGWYRTGDIGELDGEGNLYFKGRKKDVIVTPAGMKVYPEDLERALKRQPEVQDAMVVPLPRDGNAEPCGVIILRVADANPELVMARANDSLAEYQRMNRWFVWPDSDFPRTSTQKPRRNLVEQVVRNGLFRGAPPGTESPLTELIARITGRAPTNLASTANLESDLNLSSLDRVQLLSAIEDRYQIDLTDTGFSSLRTVGDLERALQGEAPPRVQYHYARWALRWPVTWIRLAVHYLLLRPAVFLLGWPKVSGRENLQNVRGPVLVVCNHVGDVDPGFVLTALPARLRHQLAVATGGEALEILRNPPPQRSLVGRTYDRLKWILGVALLNLFPLPHEAGFRESFVYAGECVDRGYSVLVFPEAHHTTDGRLRPFRPGIGLLSNNLRVPIIPMRIDGLFERKQANKKFAWPGQIRVKIGSVAKFPPETDPRQIAQELEQRIANL